MFFSRLQIVTTLALTLCGFVIAEPLPRVGKFQLGLDRKLLLDEVGTESFSTRLAELRSDGMEILNTSDGSLYFWLKSNRVVGIRGYSASFNGKDIPAEITEQELLQLLGPPSKLEVIEAQEDVGSAKNLYYTNGEMTLLVGLSSGLPRGKPGWVVTNFYLYKETWFLSPFDT